MTCFSTKLWFWMHSLFSSSFFIVIMSPIWSVVCRMGRKPYCLTEYVYHSIKLSRPTQPAILLTDWLTVWGIVVIANGQKHNYCNVVCILCCSVFCQWALLHKIKRITVNRRHFVDLTKWLLVSRLQSQYALNEFAETFYTWKLPHRRHIRCGTDRPWVVAWKCAVSSPVSVEQPEDYHRDGPATANLRRPIMV